MKLSPRLSLGTIYVLYLESMSSVKVQKQKGVRYPTLPDPWVGLHSILSKGSLIGYHTHTHTHTHTHKSYPIIHLMIGLFSSDVGLGLHAFFVKKPFIT